MGWVKSQDIHAIFLQGCTWVGGEVQTTLRGRSSLEGHKRDTSDAPGQDDMQGSVEWRWTALSIGLAPSPIPGLALLVFLWVETRFFLKMISNLLGAIPPGCPEGHPDLHPCQVLYLPIDSLENCSLNLLFVGCFICWSFKSLSFGFQKLLLQKTLVLIKQELSKLSYFILASKNWVFFFVFMLNQS